MLSGYRCAAGIDKGLSVAPRNSAAQPDPCSWYSGMMPAYWLVVHRRGLFYQLAPLCEGCGVDLRLGQNGLD